MSSGSAQARDGQLLAHWPPVCFFGGEYHKGTLLSKDRLAHWVKDMIAQAYLNDDQELLSSIKCTCHVILPLCRILYEYSYP